jgi:hypothetical protein
MQIFSLLYSSKAARHWLHFKISNSEYSVMCVSASIPDYVTRSWLPERKYSSQSIPVTSLRSRGLHEAALADSCFQLLPWPLSQSLPLFQPPLLSFSSSSFSVLSPLRCPYGCQVQSAFSMADESLLCVYPIHLRVRSLICSDTSFSCARLHRSSFQITLGQKILTYLPSL